MADLTLPPVNPDEREPDVTWWPFVIVFKAEAESASGEGKKFNLKKVVDRLIRAGTFRWWLCEVSG